MTCGECFDFINPFTRYVRVSENQQKKRRAFDGFLFTILFVGLTVYAAYSYMIWSDKHHFQPVCYSTGTSLPDNETFLKVKHLCYTPEKQEWTSFALMTYTCRGIHGGDTWAILPSNGPPTLIAPHTQPDFCARVIHDGEAVVRPFVSKHLIDTCHGAEACRQGSVDTSKTYTFQTQVGGGGGGSQEKYYELTQWTPTVNGQSAYTCCGQRILAGWERALGCLAAIGGFASLLRGVLLGVPFFCGSESNSSEQVATAASHAVKEMEMDTMMGA